MAAPPEAGQWTPGSRQTCRVCLGQFIQFDPNQSTHKSCANRERKGIDSLELRRTNIYEDFRKNGGEPPVAKLKPLEPLFRTMIFDIETHGLNRTWGRMMCFVGHIDGGPERGWHILRADEMPEWQAGDRTSDRTLAAKVFSLMETADFLVAHNGKRFDRPYLESIAFKYNLPPLPQKPLVDPCQIWRERTQFRTGGASLAGIQKFLQIPNTKTDIEPEFWNRWLWNGDTEAGDEVVDHCVADVIVLADVVEQVRTRINTFDKHGSFRI